MSRKIGIIAMLLFLMLCTAACAEKSAVPFADEGTEESVIPYADEGTEESVIPYADEGAEEFVIPFAGEGTEGNPYLIATKEDLLQLAAITNDPDLNYPYISQDNYYLLTADIALNDCSNFDTWDVDPPENAWTPIGFYLYHDFEGHFDGNGHTISGLYINAAVEDDGKGHISNQFGLFGRYGRGSIKNLHIEKAFIHPATEYGKEGAECGILAGTSSSAISGCTVEGIVICDKGYFGGVVGINYGEISDCSFQGKMLASDSLTGSYIGGIAGSAGKIRHCSVSAQLLSEEPEETTSFADIGGIAGKISPGLPINDNPDKYNSIIEDCSFSGEIRSRASAGGIAGQLCAIGGRETVSHATILDCVNNGVVIAQEDAGGIVGSVWTTSPLHELRVDGCVNRGNLYSDGTDAYIGGILGSIDTRQDGPIVIANCTNEAVLRAYCPSGIVGRVMQNGGNVRIEKCTNGGTITGEGFYTAGIVGYIHQWGDAWNLVIDQCINEADLITPHHAGGIVCFAFDTGSTDSSMIISNCVNRGSLYSDGTNAYMGGILGTDSMASVPVNIVNCVNEGDLEYTQDMVITAETLSGNLITLSRISGGIVGYTGFTPLLSVNSGERSVDNINVDDACLSIVSCSSTGNFIHREARLADDVDADLLEAWSRSGVENVLKYFISLEGGILGTIADDKAYSVKITDCTYENANYEIDDWCRYNKD